MEYTSNSPQETFTLGKRLGEQAKPGEVYCLDGDLGVGKTIFTQGFAAGLGILLLLILSDGFPCTILMYIASAISAKWTRSAMRTAFTERASV